MDGVVNLNALLREVRTPLTRTGLFITLTGRCKAEDSLRRKINLPGKNYHPEGKKVQDLLGLRITTYFDDDSDIAENALSHHFDLIDQTVDVPSPVHFGPLRSNRIYSLPDGVLLPSLPKDISSLIDSTFEVQYRTVLSEGWLEVEHDFRYKSIFGWPDVLDRQMNAIGATLELCDSAMLSLIKEMAHSYYKKNEVVSMLKAVLRLRLIDDRLDPEINQLLHSDKMLRKAFLRCDRKAAVLTLAKSNRTIPLTLNNLVQCINQKSVQSHKISSLCPPNLFD